MTALDPGQLSKRPDDEGRLCLPIASTILSEGVTTGMTRVLGLWWNNHHRDWRLQTKIVASSLWWTAQSRAQ